MGELFILLAPFFWSIKNDITRFSRSLYRMILFYVAASGLFIFLMTKLLDIGMVKLRSLSADVFQILLVKGYSLIFLIIVFVQILNGIVISLTTFYHTKDLEILFVSPVNRAVLFLSKLIETHIKASWMLVIFGLPLIISAGTLYSANPIYYIYAIMLFIFFSITLVNIGAGFTVLAASFFEARRLKKVLISVGIIAAVLLLTLVRLFRPERLINPELFANATLFLVELKTPSFILLPNRWLSESLFDFLGKTFSANTFIFVSLLCLTSYITTFVLLEGFKKYHYRGWELLQQGNVRLREKTREGILCILLSKSRLTSTMIRTCTTLFRSESGALVQKELLSQVRDARNIHQALIVASLIIIYLFSIRVLPLDWENYAIRLKYVTSFFNLGLILVIIASLCSRFVYPAVVSDAASFWIIKSSPVTPRRYIGTKFLFFLAPVFLLGQSLTVISCLIIGIEKEYTILSVITTSLLCLSLVGMTIAFGVSGFKNAFRNADKEQTSSGSILYMIASVSLILMTLMLEILPTYLYFLKASRQAEFVGRGWLIIGTIIAALVIMNVLISAFSLILGIRKIDNLELT